MAVEWAWNSVDVRGDDGLFHSGRVIDAVDGQLLVDFGGTGPSGPRMVSLGEVYYCCYNTHCLTQPPPSFHNPFPSPLSEKRPVEVLLRQTPQDPWKWYPGRLLDDFGLVTVTVAERELRGIVMGRRIREVLTEEQLAPSAVTKDQFVKKRLMVPDCREIGGSLPPDDQLIVLFNAHCRRRDYWMMATQVFDDPNRRGIRELEILQNLRPVHLHSPQYFGVRIRLPGALPQILLSLLKSGASAPKPNLLLTPTPACSDDAIQSIYRDPTILPYIFDYLSTVQQNQLRPMCRQWNTVVTSAYTRRILTVFAPRNDANCPQSVYRYASCLYNCWTLDTRVLLIHGASAPPQSGGTRLRDTARFLQHVMDEKRASISGVLLLAGEWYLCVDTPNWVQAVWDVLHSLAGVFREIVLNVGVYVDISGTRRGRELILVRFSNQRITRQLTVQEFWTRLDHMCEVNPPDEERFSRWIASITAHQDNVQMPNIPEPADPRECVLYRGVSFYRYGQAGLEGVDVRQLNKLTLHALFNRLDEDRRRRVIRKNKETQTPPCQGAGTSDVKRVRQEETEEKSKCNVL